VKLSEHFTLEEMLQSRTASRLGILNVPSSAQILHRLAYLCEGVLEPVRKHFGVPVIIASGYRSPALNKRVGGAQKSQHVTGQAADIHVFGVHPKVVAEWIRDNLDVDQVILEYNDWVHVSYVYNGNRNEALTAKRVNNKTQYFEGVL